MKKRKILNLVFLCIFALTVIGFLIAVGKLFFEPDAKAAGIAMTVFAPFCFSLLVGECELWLDLHYFFRERDEKTTVSTLWHGALFALAVFLVLSAARMFLPVLRLSFLPLSFTHVLNRIQAHLPLLSLILLAIMFVRLVCAANRGSDSMKQYREHLEMKKETEQKNKNDE